MVDVEQLGPPVDARSLIGPERAALLGLLRDLADRDWAAPTVCPGWTVRDVTAHLLHDDLRRISRSRDGYPATAFPDGEPLAIALNRANERWVDETAFLSPALLVDLLALTSRLVDAMWQGMDQHTLGEGVSWAGVDPAPVWLDLAREYTESWIHQQQIRDATGRPGATEPAFLDAVLDTFLRALPWTYRDVPAVPGTSVEVTLLDGDRVLAWSLTAGPAGWTVARGRPEDPDAAVRLPADVLWRLATRGLEPPDAARVAAFEGDEVLASQALQIVSIIR